MYIYQSFWDKIWNVITYHGTYNFGDKKKEKKTPHQIYDQTKLTTLVDTIKINFQVILQHLTCIYLQVKAYFADITLYDIT